MIQLTPKQIEYIDRATHRWCIKSGAVRSGKSFVDTAAVIPRRIIERKGEPGLSVIIGVSKSTIERNVLQPMREIYGQKRIGQVISSKNTAMLFGEEVYCLVLRKSVRLPKLIGGVDHATECDDNRCRKSRRTGIQSGAPVSGSSLHDLSRMVT